MPEEKAPNTKDDAADTQLSRANSVQPGTPAGQKGPQDKLGQRSPEDKPASPRAV